MRKLSFLLAIVSVALLQACGSDNPNRGKPIVLGDPATIVTEADSQYLQDFVADIQPVQQPVAAPAETPAADTAKQQEAPKEEPKQEPKKEDPKKEETSAAPTGKGLNVAFKEVTVLIPDIVTRSYKQQDTKKANGASYELTGGNLNGNKIKTGGGKVTEVSQRYQTVIAVKTEMGTLLLESLNRTTDWQKLKGGNNTYTISGLDAKRLQYLNAKPAAIRNAVSRAVRAKRMSKANEQKWMKAISKVRDANDKPLVVVLRSVMWKIEGKDANGKSYQKQLRIDIPL